MKLKPEFYIVLISTYSRNITNELIKLLDKKGNSLDAVYIQRHRKWHLRHLHDISSILEDFKVVDKGRVLVVSAIGIDVSEINSRQGKDLIYENSNSNKKKFLCYHAPTCENDIPITILTPHIRLNIKTSYFNCLTEFVLEFKKNHSDFFSGFDRYNRGIKLKICLDGKQSTIGFDKGSHAHKFIYFNRECLPLVKPSTSQYQIRVRKKKIYQFLNLINK